MRTRVAQGRRTARRCLPGCPGTAPYIGSSSGSPDPTRGSRCASAATSRLSSGLRSTRVWRVSTPRAGTALGPRRSSNLIAERPATRAPDLAASLGRETAPFKADVRKLKELGLTESLEIGYRLSPRGRAYYGYRGVARKRSRSR